MTDAELFLERLFTPRQTPNWWANLLGEVLCGLKGRYLSDTLAMELRDDVPHYRTDARTQYFFGTGKIDGRFKNVGVEEKTTGLTWRNLIDGTICRGLVWVLGNSQDLPTDREAVGLYVVKQGVPPISPQIMKPLTPVLHALQRIGIHIVFVQENTGYHWRAGTGALPPCWLSAGGCVSSELAPYSQSGLDYLENNPLPAGSVTKKFPGNNSVFQEVALQDTKVAISSMDAMYSQWWMMETSLLLRGMGYGAVKITYTRSDSLRHAGRGVEKRLQTEMRNQFGILLDWGVDL